MKRAVIVGALFALFFLTHVSWSKDKKETKKSPFPVLESTVKPEAAATEKIVVKVDGVEVALPVGTPVRLQVQQNLRGNKTTDGQKVDFKAYEDVLGPDGKILIAKGAPAVGQVTKRKGAKGFGKSSELTFIAESVTAVDGSQIPVTFSFTQDARNKGIIRINRVLNPFGKGGDAKVRINSICEAYIGTAPPVAETVQAPAEKPADAKSADAKKPKQ